MTSHLFEGVTAYELKRLRELIAAAHRFRGLLRLFADRLPLAPAESSREILRSRIDCVLTDSIATAIRDLESALAEVEEGEARL
jgi:hypothetical protein